MGTTRERMAAAPASHGWSRGRQTSPSSGHSRRREFGRASSRTYSSAAESSSSSSSAAASSSSSSLRGRRRPFASTWLHHTVSEMMKRLPDGEEKKRGLVCVTRSTRVANDGKGCANVGNEDGTPPSTSFIYALDNCDEIDANAFWEDELVDSVACLRRIDDDENVNEEIIASDTGNGGRMRSAKRDAQAHPAASAAEATTWELYVLKRSGFFGEGAREQIFCGGDGENSGDCAYDGRGNCSFIVRTTSTFCPYDETGACHKCTRFTLTPSSDMFA